MASYRRTTTISRIGYGWLFAGSLRGGQRAAAIMSLIQSAKLNGHDPYAYLKDILERLPTQPACRIEDLLHKWTPSVGPFGSIDKV
jgi:transposase